VHVSSRTGFPHDRGGAANMIRVAVGEHQLLELGWRTAQPADRPEDYCLLTRESGVDQRQSVIALDQEGVCEPHRDDVYTFAYENSPHDVCFPFQAFPPIASRSAITSEGI
jgi:hypothetical protein